MTQEINIAEILRDKPKGTKLYSPICGECELNTIDSFDYITEIHTISNDNEDSSWKFDGEGRYNYLGECLLFPSKEMRDWSKFAWKKGDVLVSNDDKTEVIFDRFKDDTYTSFVGRHALNDYTMYYNDVDFYKTDFFSIEEENAAQRYTNTIEERLGGKLNMETLEIEQSKPKWTPKPFDKVIVRDENYEKWRAAFFSHMDNSDSYIFCCSNSHWRQCIPYNEKTAKLIGTTKSLEELK